MPTLPVVNTTSLNSLTIWPGPNSPREPPDLPEGQVLCITNSVRERCARRGPAGRETQCGRGFGHGAAGATHECSLASSVNLPITSPEASMVALSSRHLASSLTRMWLADADTAAAVPTRAAVRPQRACHYPSGAPAPVPRPQVRRCPSLSLAVRVRTRARTRPALGRLGQQRGPGAHAAARRAEQRRRLGDRAPAPLRAGCVWGGRCPYRPGRARGGRRTWPFCSRRCHVRGRTNSLDSPRTLT